MKYPTCKFHFSVTVLLAFSLMTLQACTRTGNEPVSETSTEDVISDDPKSDDGEPSGDTEAAVVNHLRILGHAPGFVLTDQSGEEFSSNQLHGKPWTANWKFLTGS